MYCIPRALIDRVSLRLIEILRMLITIALYTWMALIWRPPPFNWFQYKLQSFRSIKSWMEHDSLEYGDAFKKTSKMESHHVTFIQLILSEGHHSVSRLPTILSWNEAWWEDGEGGFLMGSDISTFQLLLRYLILFFKSSSTKIVISEEGQKNRPTSLWMFCPGLGFFLDGLV